MMKSGFRIIKDDPLTGVGPDMIIQVYPHYRDKTAVNQLNPHLHNVPLQIAAERGLPALAVWLWFIVTLVRDFIKRRRSEFPSLSNAGLAVIGAMLAAGLFEYNFGDSEFLMLFLVLVTLPYAAERAPVAASAFRFPMPAAPTDLKALLDRARGRAVLIVGDLMLDHFVIGRVDRISPEAPVPVVQFDHESYRLGGAANVAHNVAALGGTVEIAGLVGTTPRARAWSPICARPASAPPR